MDAVVVGIDLVDVAEIEQSIRTFGDRFLHRIYTADELAYADSSAAHRAARLAARFAAKEAVIKVLRPVDQPVPWRDIEILRGASGACNVKLTGLAADLASKSGIRSVSVSLTHHGNQAAAMAAGVQNESAREGGLDV